MFAHIIANAPLYVVELTILVLGGKAVWDARNERDV